MLINVIVDINFLSKLVRNCQNLNLFQRWLNILNIGVASNMYLSYLEKVYPIFFILNIYSLFGR
ncbi:hypothetical protein JCM30760_15770 [Thiomicrorhabdus hydrogeniphila]